jgi:hypothetical protein
MGTEIQNLSKKQAVRCFAIVNMGNGNVAEAKS